MTDAIAIVCFGAGGARFAVASADVVRLDDQAAAADHLATVLALAAAPAATVRVMTLAAGGAARALAVDGPLRVATVTAAQIVPSPPGLAPGPVLGFAVLDGELVQLLDTSRLVAGAAPTAAAPATSAPTPAPLDRRSPW
ncbi:MAG: hypothetical protein IPL61_14535 [Myxococcales bacterium]|nr:hypothetical protein [Myxococcales bacterium]